MAPHKLEFDPARLLALDRQRGAKRALTNAAYDDYQELRARRAEVQRRAQVARAEASSAGPRGRHGIETEALRLEAEVLELSRQMREKEAQADELGAEASAAGAFFKSALAHAIKVGLMIPAELLEAANAASGGIQPLGVALSGGAV